MCIAAFEGSAQEGAVIDTTPKAIGFGKRPVIDFSRVSVPSDTESKPSAFSAQHSASDAGSRYSQFLLPNTERSLSCAMLRKGIVYLLSMC